MSSLKSYLLGLAAGIVVIGVVDVILIIASAHSGYLCPGSKAPATNPSVTTRCFDTGGPLPSGYHWDPGGNAATGE